MSEHSTSDTEQRHYYAVGSRFKTLESYRWRVTNRMVDVDTDEVLYYIQGLDPDAANHGEAKVITESKLRENYTETDVETTDTASTDTNQ